MDTKGKVRTGQSYNTCFPNAIVISKCNITSIYMCYPANSLPWNSRASKASTVKGFSVFTVSPVNACRAETKGNWLALQAKDRVFCFQVPMFNQNFSKCFLGRWHV